MPPRKQLAPAWFSSAARVPAALAHLPSVRHLIDDGPRRCPEVAQQQADALRVTLAAKRGKA